MDVYFNLYLTHIRIGKQKLLNIYKIKKRLQCLYYTYAISLISSVLLLYNMQKSNIAEIQIEGQPYILSC